MQTTANPTFAPRPWLIPMQCAAIAWVGGIGAGFLSLWMMNYKSSAGWGFFLSLCATLVVAVLDTVAFVGGIVAIVKVRRSGSETGLAASIGAMLLGLFGYPGVILLLFNSTLYQYAPR